LDFGSVRIGNFIFSDRIICGAVERSREMRKGEDLQTVRSDWDLAVEAVLRTFVLSRSRERTPLGADLLFRAYCPSLTTSVVWSVVLSAAVRRLGDL